MQLLHLLLVSTVQLAVLRLVVPLLLLQGPFQVLHFHLVHYYIVLVLFVLLVRLQMYLRQLVLISFLLDVSGLLYCLFDLL